MTWDEAPARFKDLARSVCTDRQLRAFILRTNDLTYEEIGNRLGIRRQTAQQHVRVAEDKIRIAIVRYNIPHT